MSFAGFKKQLNKANQMINEKMAGARGTELDSEFVEMERKIDVANKMTEELVVKTQEYLQPNPMARARLTAVRGLNNLQHKNRSTAYPQPEGILGESMTKYGKDFGQDTPLGSALVDCGDTYRQMAEIKYNFEDVVKQNFLDPFSSMQQQELKEINHHRKKLEGRRLDYDCKKRRAANKSPEEDALRSAEDKFVETRSQTETAMRNFLGSDVEQVSALLELVTAELNYHEAAADMLKNLRDKLQERRSEAQSQPKFHAPSAAAASASANSSQSALESADAGPVVSMRPRHETAAVATPTCRALYAFVAENKTELAFEEGDVIELVSKVDDNWYEGRLKGKTGYFPVSYVDVIVPLK